MVEMVFLDVGKDGGGDEAIDGSAFADASADVGAADGDERGGNAAGENSPDRFFAYRLAERTKVARFRSGAG